MRSVGIVVIVAAALATPTRAALAAGAGEAGEAVQITIYNQDFALVRQVRLLRLKEGENEVRVGGVPSLLEADSVVLRDRQDPKGLRVLEQRYSGDTLSQASLLRRSEGKTVSFQTINPATGRKEIVSGKVIRSGYGPPGSAGQGAASPIIEVDGKIQFSLPGEPVFEPPGPDAPLDPQLFWNLWSDRAGERSVELSYLTGGMGWQATYNAVTTGTGVRLDLTGWITLTNGSGAEFADARVKLMAGEVNRAQQAPRARALMMEAAAAAPLPGPAEVTEKTFDDYHLYTLPRPVTIAGQGTQQFELCRGGDVPAERLYVYDGSERAIYAGWTPEMARTRPDYGTESNTRVTSMLEFTNGRTSGLGIPLPAGLLRVYRADEDGSRELVGESAIGPVAADEKVRVSLGGAFDLAGERRQTNYRVDTTRQNADESFEIRLRNHKKETIDVRVVEHLARWSAWKMVDSSDPYLATDARTIEFRAKIPPDGEKVITYHVRYSW